jgi:hypothetical protein
MVNRNCQSTTVSLTSPIKIKDLKSIMTNEVPTVSLWVVYLKLLKSKKLRYIKKGCYEITKSDQFNITFKPRLAISNTAQRKSKLFR